jgi:hypothetical protein
MMMMILVVQYSAGDGLMDGKFSRMFMGEERKLVNLALFAIRIKCKETVRESAA